jgi:hypothetical protein
MKLYHNSENMSESLWKKLARRKFAMKLRRAVGSLAYFFCPLT